MEKIRSLAVASLALAVSTVGCASHSPVLATDGELYVFGTVQRWHEPGGAGTSRLRAAAEKLCGGKDTYALDSRTDPPGETPPLSFVEEESGNPLRRDFAEYAVVACRNGAARAAGDAPKVRVLHPYEAVSEDLPARAPDEVRLARYDERGRRAAIPLSAIESIEARLRAPYSRDQIEVKLRADYPTAKDPDRWLGFFEVGPLASDADIRAIAAQHGADLAVQVRSDENVYLTFHISRTYPSVDDAVARLELPSGFKQAGAPVRGDLATAGVLSVPVQLGQCYTFVGALAADATIEEAPTIRRTWQGKLAVLLPNDLPRFRDEGRAFASSIGCVAWTSSAGIVVGWKDAKARGASELRVYARPATAEERKKLELFATLTTCQECTTDRPSCLREAGVTEAQCTTALRSERPLDVGGLILDGTR